MPTSKAQQKATAKYVKQNYDRIEIKVPKGRKAELQVHAEQRGESLNAFIGRAIQETVKRDAQEATEAFSTCSLSHDCAKMAHSASEATGGTPKEVK